MEVLGLKVLGNLLDEDVSIVELASVSTEELLVELEGSAWLVVELYVSQLLCNLVELFIVVDLQHCGIEMSSEISSNLRGNLDIVVSLLLDFFGDLSTIHCLG